MSTPGNPPLLSVLVPAWNPTRSRVDLTVRAVRSVGENAVDVEIVVVDDSSPGDLYSILEDALSTLGSVRLSRNDANLGMARNWNRCIELANGTWMGLLCSDDEYRPHGIRRACDLLRSLREPSLVLQDPAIRRDRETVPPGRDAVRAVRLPMASGNFWHRKAIEGVGRVDERFVYSPDAEFWYRIATRFPVVKVREPFARYHLHGQNYMWTTWGRDDFLEQTELLNRTVLAYGMGEDARDAGKLQRMVDEGLWRTLITILRHTFFAKDRRDLFRRYFPIARARANTPARKADLLLALAVAVMSRIRRRLTGSKIDGSAVPT